MTMHRREALRLLSLSSIAAGVPDRIASSWPAQSVRPRAQPPGPFAPDIELALTASPGTASILPGAATNVWRFSGELLKGPSTALQTIPGSFLGPVIRAQRGQKLRIRFRNQLGEPSIVHWHGLD